MTDRFGTDSEGYRLLLAAARQFGQRPCSVAVVALRTRSLRQARLDDCAVALRLLADRRDELGAARTLTIHRLQRLLVELVPGEAKKALTARPARALLADAPACDVVRETSRGAGGRAGRRAQGHRRPSQDRQEAARRAGRRTR